MILDKIFGAMTVPGALQYAGAFAWGAASVILSPCGIAAVPLVVGYIGNTDLPSKLSALKISCAFCLGIIINLMLVALIVSGMGLFFGGYERLLNVIVVSVFFMMGLHLIGLVKIHLNFFPFFFFNSGGSGMESQDLRGAVTLGIVSGLAVGPCNIAYISPVLSLALSKASQSFFSAAGLILAYALGYSFVIILSGTFTQLASSWLQSDKGNKALCVLNTLCGIALIAAGIYLLNEMRYLI